MAPIYKPHQKHRDKTPLASQWTIKSDEENMSFSSAWEAGYCIDNQGWGLHMIDKSIAYLGVASDQKTEVFVAKFVADPTHGVWHGYPADHQKYQQDIPDPAVRRIWLSEELLPAPKLRKLMLQQRCRL